MIRELLRDKGRVVTDGAAGVPKTIAAIAPPTTDFTTCYLWRLFLGTIAPAFFFTVKFTLLID